MNRFAKASLLVGPARRDGDKVDHIHRAAACLQTKARPPTLTSTLHTKAGPTPQNVMTHSATLKAKGISKELIVPKTEGILARKGIGKHTSHQLHPRAQLQDPSSLSLRRVPIHSILGTKAMASTVTPYHKSHQQLIKTEAMEHHSPGASSSTAGEHELADLPGLIGDEGISFPHWSRDEEEHERKNHKKKSKPKHTLGYYYGRNHSQG